MTTNYTQQHKKENNMKKQNKKGGGNMMEQGKQTETLLTTKNKQEAEEITQFVKGLDQGNRERLLDFIKGVGFALGIQGTKENKVFPQ